MPPIAKIFAVLLASCCFAAPASAETILSGQQLQTTLSGRTFEGRNGMMRATISYRADGTLEVRAMMRTMVGRWWIEEDTLCADMPEGPRAGQGCGQMIANGDGTYRSPNGMVLSPQ
ncbi:MAG: hypothetical protein JJ908_00825 [Rhizobiales bacterium]|nr:hypothetical protein [Hyphomicrobiales bacterium]MBO6698857.1 hypothetical protein [Hyphomicrobiales bacterium]MBO6734890.1 hypothetical protein [Hyphomicrobiales bacterium]MBO6911304.1 hypothetical protein [Hyphomicrobiales bacterium]MBO6956198.1 hypothetical protein [Hyphomicrobiales bacterium]